MDIRHVKRVKIIKNIFSWSFNKKPNFPFSEEKETSVDILKNVKKIDALIKKYAPKFEIDRIAKIDLSILRLSLYELIIEKDKPFKVIIDEAVELAKEFGGEQSYAFVNGVLGSVLKDLQKQTSVK